MEEQVTVSCLGRPMAVGMLYDCRKDELITGMKLWDQELIEKNSSVLLQESSEFHVNRDDSMENKARLLNIGTELKLSVLSGLVQVEGAAKYINNNKSSDYQARVVLKYSYKSGMEELSMIHPDGENIGHPYTLKDSMATHVITAIEYGADAVFVFDQKESTSEHYHEMERKLEISLEKIPNVKLTDAGGSISMQMNEEDRKLVDSFKCTFHGDIILEENLATFDDAAVVYKKLPELIRKVTHKGIYGVPKKAYLYPLCKLDSKAAKLVHSISNNVVNEAQSILEDITRILAIANDLEKSDVSQKFLRTRNEIAKFKTLLNQFRSDFQRQLCELLPKIRGGGMEENELLKKLKKIKSSPYDISKLDTWINMKKNEFACLEKYIESLNDFPFASQPGELQKYTQDDKFDYVLCLSLENITNSKSTFLEMMKTYLSNEDTNMDDNMEACEECWSEDFEVTNNIRNKIREFKEFAELNKNQAKLKFVVSSFVFKKNENTDSCSIILYSNAGHPTVFQLPKGPGKPEMISNTENEITISWTAPTVKVENVLSYNILYRKVNTTNDNWSCVKTENSKLTFTVKELTPGTEYLFKIEAVYEDGKTKTGVESSPIQTKANLSAVHDSLKNTPRGMVFTNAILKFIISHQSLVDD